MKKNGLQCTFMKIEKNYFDTHLTESLKNHGRKQKQLNHFAHKTTKIDISNFDCRYSKHVQCSKHLKGYKTSWGPLMKIIVYWALPFYPILSGKYHWRMWKHLNKNKTGLALKYSWQNWMKYYKLLYLTNRSIGKERIVASQIQRITEVIAFKMYILLGSTYWKQRCSKWRSNRTSNVCLFSTVLKLKIYCFWRSNLIIFAIYSNTKTKKSSQVFPILHTYVFKTIILLLNFVLKLIFMLTDVLLHKRIKKKYLVLKKKLAKAHLNYLYHENIWVKTIRMKPLSHRNL